MFCAMATVIDRCKTEGVVDVFQVVKALRVQKPGAVPTLVRVFTRLHSNLYLFNVHRRITGLCLMLFLSSWTH